MLPYPLLLLVSIATALTGALLTRRLGALARHGTRITAVVLLVTGAYLTWYWLPAAASGGATASSTALVRFSASVSTWLQGHTTTIAVLAAAAVLAVAAAAWRYGRSAGRRSGLRSTPDPGLAECCGPDTAEHNPPQVAR